MDRLLVIADDFTGALDTGIQFAKKGFKTEVICFYGKKPIAPSNDTSVLVLNSCSRHLPPDEAYKKVFSIVSDYWKVHCNYLYKKTDSALRGNIGSELAAVSDATGRQISFFPAFPSMKRITKKGIHYIDGVPVADSIFGRDILNPVRNSNVIEIIREQTTKKAEIANAPTTETEKANIVVFDSETDSDFRNLATLVGAAKLDVVAGCAGFAGILSDTLNFPKVKQQSFSFSKGLFVISGSINEVSLSQIGYAHGKGCPRFALSEKRKTDTQWMNSEAGRLFFTEVISTYREKGCCIVDVDKLSDSVLSPDFVQKRGVIVARTMGIIARTILDKTRVPNILCIGGDTLQAFVDECGIENIELLGEMLPGVVVTKVRYKKMEFQMLCKSGGFGEEDTLFKILEQTRCMENTDER